jgi:FAD/FMN-containing dehydrogenase
MDEVSRRELLKRGAVAGIGAMALPGVELLSLEASGAVPPPAISDAAAPKLTGRVVRPNDPGYNQARRDWDRLFTHYPMAVVFCRNGQDVVNAVTWARRRDLAVRARSGRHSLEGWSNLDGGLVIDVSEMKRVHLDAATHTATVGAGLTQGEIVAQLGRRGFAIPTGSEASVGVVGATLGGGFGFLTRAFGLACDNLLAVRIAVPAGRKGARLITANRTHNSDLLWACRGGGGGNFGIVTSLTYRVHPIGKVAFLTAKWPDFSSLKAAFEAWQRSAPHTDRRLSSVLEVDPSSFQMFAVLESGTADEARRLLRPVLGKGNPTVSVESKSWPEVFASFNSGPRQYDNWKFFSQFVSEPFPGKAIEIVRRHMERAPSPPSNFFCSSFGGAVRNAPAGGSAFPHRDALFYAEPGAGWNGDRLTSKSQAWVARFGQALRPYVSGAYVNVPNAAMADWPHAYYGRNFARLRRVKSRYDPHDLFHFEQSIPPA